jgi:sulfide dehydrogenase cytochrome subunit
MLTRKRLGIAIAITLLASTGVYADGHGNKLGETVGVTCAGCHGTDGVSKGAAPSLKGLPQEHLESAMVMFKNGKRPGSIMPRIAKGYTDEQIKAVAAYFSSMK